MASKRQNMFKKNKTQETTKNGERPKQTGICFMCLIEYIVHMCLLKVSMHTRAHIGYLRILLDMFCRSFVEVRVLRGGRALASIPVIKQLEPTHTFTATTSGVQSSSLELLHKVITRRPSLQPARGLRGRDSEDRAFTRGLDIQEVHRRGGENFSTEP
ncbi:hypothetical protein AAG570_012180 [Ranatra chinensis]|uniref:Uncharacterized protein n=1 Tax=Ranatra chinensis TaxID=642074 RepID=A0ABD0YK49_9HEMI